MPNIPCWSGATGDPIRFFRVECDVLDAGGWCSGLGLGLVWAVVMQTGRLDCDGMGLNNAGGLGFVDVVLVIVEVILCFRRCCANHPG